VKIMRALAGSAVAMLTLWIASCTSDDISEREAILIANSYANKEGVRVSDYRVYSVCYFSESVSVLFEAKASSAGDHFSVNLDRRNRAVSLEWGH